MYAIRSYYAGADQPDRQRHQVHRSRFGHRLYLGFVGGRAVITSYSIHYTKLYDKELQEAYGEAMLELRARKKLQSLLGEEDK